MAITPLTGFKAFTFDGEVSTDYGVAILGEGVFNAPERDVEMITIPGRSGQFVLDNGRFENIEVTYPANLIAESTEDFAEAISDFRNMLCSKKGYVRLQDDYHPDEYRMAVYKEGLDVDEKVLRAGEFEITFDCKPQRWLTSGEELVEVESGDTLTNPTLFESSPMIETYGYGTLTVNGHEIELENRPLGDVTVLGSKKKNSSTGTVVGEWTIDKSQILAGDTLTMDSQKVSSYEGSVSVYASFDINEPNADRITVGSYTQSNLEYISGSPSGYTGASITGLLSPATFTEGTASSVSGSGSANVNIYEGATLMETATVSFSITLAYDGDDKITATLTESIVTDAQGYLSNDRVSVTTSKVVGFSTISALGNPTYIDCDLGACYMIENDEIIDLNGYIDLGSDLPTLGVGENEITFDNTFTEVDVIPRWWKV